MGNEQRQRPKSCAGHRDKVNGPIYILQWFRQTMARMNEQLSKLTANDEFEQITHELEKIEQYQNQVEAYLLEESFAKLASYQRRTNDVIMQHIPEGMRFFPTKDGVTISGIPLWMIGHKSHQKLPPLYHRNRPLVRKIPMWQAMFGHLKSSYLQSVLKEDNVLPDKPSGYAHVVFHFHTNHLNVRDLDHYDVAPIINACVSNGFLLSDHPSRLTLTMVWNETKDQPRLDVHVRYLDSPIYLPLD